MKRLVLFMTLMVLLCAPTAFAQGDTSTVFIKAMGGVLAAQEQDPEDVAGTFHLEVIRMIPWLPGNFGAIGRYSTIFKSGEDQSDYNGRVVLFSNDPNVSELKGDWVAFVTWGGLQLHDNEEEEGSGLAQMSTDGSVGLIVPVGGMNLVIEVGGKRMDDSFGEAKTFWTVGFGFFGVPKL